MKNKIIVTDFDVSAKFMQLRTSALDRKIPFSLTLNKVRELLKQEKCYFTGIPFGADDSKRTIDRVESHLGYTNDNVVAVTSIFNKKKGELSFIEIEQLYNGMLKHYKKIQAKQKKEKEIWKPINNFPNYQISNFGKIKNNKDVLIKTNGKNIRLSFKGIKQSFNIIDLVNEHFFNKEDKNQFRSIISPKFLGDEETKNRIFIDKDGNEYLLYKELGTQYLVHKIINDKPYLKSVERIKKHLLTFLEKRNYNLN